jgi:hypothetical protein
MKFVKPIYFSQIGKMTSKRRQRQDIYRKVRGHNKRHGVG